METKGIKHSYAVLRTKSLLRSSDNLTGESNKGEEEGEKKHKVRRISSDFRSNSSFLEEVHFLRDVSKSNC